MTHTNQLISISSPRIAKATTAASRFPAATANPIMMKFYGGEGGGMPGGMPGGPGGFPGAAGGAPGARGDDGPTVEEVD